MQLGVLCPSIEEEILLRESRSLVGASVDVLRPSHSGVTCQSLVLLNLTVQVQQLDDLSKNLWHGVSQKDA